MIKSNTGKTPFNSSRVKRSEKLTKEETRSLRSFVRSYHTNTDAAEAIGISREVLFNVMAKGSGASTTVTRIREALKVFA